MKFSHGTTISRWRSYDRTNLLRTPTMQENQLLLEKTTSSVFVSTIHVQTLCMPSFIDFHARMHTRHQARPSDVFCLRSKHFRSIAGCTTRRSTRSIATELKHETLPANHARGCLKVDCTMYNAVLVNWHAACSRRIVLDGHHPVMTGHNARRPRTGRERRP